MGVQLGGLAEKRPITIDELSGRKVAVDAFNTIYQFLSSIRQRDGTPLMDGKGRVTSHLSGIFYRNANLISNGIKPIYVFDGEHPSFKGAEIEERARKKEEAGEKYRRAKEEGLMEKARMYAQATSRLTPEMVEESKSLLSFMGIPAVEAPSEGEAQAAKIVLDKKAYAVSSQDFDCLLFGAPILIRNLSITGRRKLPRRNEYVTVEPEEISLGKTLSALGVTRKQLVWVGMLTGTDFNKGVKGIGPKKGLAIVKGCKSLKDVIKHAEAKFGHSFHEDMERIEDFFLNPPVRDVSISFPQPDKEGLISFLCDERGFSSERVGKTADAMVKKAEEKGEQSRMGRWL